MSQLDSASYCVESTNRLNRLSRRVGKLIFKFLIKNVQIHNN